MNAMKSKKGILGLRKSSRGNSLIPIIVVLVATPLLTVLMFQFYMMPKMSKMLGDGGHGEHGSAHGHGEEAHGEGDHGGGGGHGGHGAGLSKRFERIVANLAGEHRTRFILVSYDLSGSNPAFENVIDSNKSKIKHDTISYLSSLSLKEINNNTKMQDKAGRELKTALNNLPGIDGIIDDLFFVEFNIQ